MVIKPVYSSSELALEKRRAGSAKSAEVRRNSRQSLLSYHAERNQRERREYREERYHRELVNGLPFRIFKSCHIS